MKSTYCPHCGALLQLKEIGDEGLVPYCEDCQKPIFDHAPVCMLAMVMNESNEVAILKQNYVSTTYYGFVAGYNKVGESIEKTVKREIKEEIDQEVVDYKYVESYYLDRIDTLFFLFIVHVKEKPFKLSNEVDEAKWVNIQEALPLLNPKGVALRLLNAYIKIETR